MVHLLLGIRRLITGPRSKHISSSTRPSTRSTLARFRFSSVRSTLRSLTTKHSVIIISSRGHRGRKSIVYTTRFTAPSVVGFVTMRTQKLVYLTVAKRQLSRLSLPLVIDRGAFRSRGRRATFAIDVSTTLS